MKHIVAFDESGNSGANLLDSEQPVFVLASVYLSSDETANLIDPNSDEMKFSKLRRSSIGRRKIIEILNSELLIDEKSLISGFHKPYMIITKMVDLLIEPMFYESGIDLYVRGANIALSNMLFFAMPAFIGRHAFEAMQAAFVEMIRSPSTATANQFYSILSEARSNLKDSEFAQEMDMLIATKPVAEEFFGKWDGSDLDPAIPAFVEHASIWTSRLNTEFQIVHDASKPIQQQQLVLEAMMSTSEGAVSIGYDRRKMVFPIKAKGIEFFDSSLYPQIQVADIVASSAAYVLRASLRHPTDSLAQNLQHTRVLSGSFRPVWPEAKVTPEELGTTNIDGIDANNYIGEYVSKKLNGIPPKGNRSK
ncbi:DUF3800 domain-containing protein [bacterium]|nr:DUF3800 domain-containing protein [bacterium]